MGLLVDGVWQDQWYDTAKTGGRFVRSESQFRNWITPDGTAGPAGEDGFAAEAGRYHLYISRACPWAHRTMIFRALKGLEAAISFSVTHWVMAEQGWTFESGPGVIEDTLNGAHLLYEVYKRASPTYTGRVTVPVLWDKQRCTIVNNGSGDIIRMLNSAFDQTGAREGDYYPEDLHGEIDDLNARIYNTVNNGVYRAGFATSQTAYEEAVSSLFETLDWLEERLARRPFLCGERQTEADWRLFTTLLRFDVVYVGHFKCNIRRLAEYRTSGHTHASSIRRQAFARRSIFGISKATTTRATTPSIRRASCRSGPRSILTPRRIAAGLIASKLSSSGDAIE
jgi:putative glutathione S-transferase